MRQTYRVATANPTFARNNEFMKTESSPDAINVPGSVRPGSQAETDIGGTMSCHRRDVKRTDVFAKISFANLSIVAFHHYDRSAHQRPEHRIPVRLGSFLG